MLKEYLGIDVKGLGWLAGMAAASALVVTGLYWSLYGMDKWTTKMQQGANLMMAAVPVTSQGQAGVGTSAAGQFVCPQHGAVGLPTVDAAGVPHCPVCSQVMCFNSASNGLPPNSMVLAAGG